MSDTAVSSLPRLAAPVPSDATVAPRPRRDIDLYAEGNSFAEPEDTETQLKALFGDDGFDFKDLLDIVNPLQHLPVVGTLYRALTGDALAPGPRILGGTLFGGIGGFVASLANAVMENETGSDLGDKALALFHGDSAPALAQSAPPTANLAAAVVETVQPEPGQIQTQAADRKSLPIFAGPPTTLAKTAVAAATPTSDTENPTEALIRARAAVPMSHRARSAGLPPGAAYSPARTLQSQPQAAPALALATAAQTAPGANTPAATGSTDAAAAPAAPAPDVAVMMRDALNKYEALMKGRADHSISSEF
jgi:hypothetical protein